MISGFLLHFVKFNIAIPTFYFAEIKIEKIYAKLK